MAEMPAETEVKSELNLSEPSEKVAEWAKTNIKEDQDTRCEMLEELRDMIYSRGECTPHRTDDPFLLRFLRARNFSLEGAYKLFVNYYIFKEENPQFYDNVGFALLNKIGENDVINVPPYREQTGRRMLLYRLGNWDPEIFEVDDLLRATLLILELAILEPQAQIKGGICLIDFADVSMQQVWYLNPSVAYKVVQIMVTSFYMKVHALHIVNQSYVFDMGFNLFKPFIDDRMRERIFFHGSNMESLHKHIDPKCLPQRYGGVHPHYNYNDWLQGFKSSAVICKEMESLGYKTKEDKED